MSVHSRKANSEKNTAGRWRQNHNPLTLPVFPSAGEKEPARRSADSAALPDTRGRYTANRFDDATSRRRRDISKGHTPANSDSILGCIGFGRGGKLDLTAALGLLTKPLYSKAHGTAARDHFLYSSSRR